VLCLPLLSAPWPIQILQSYVISVLCYIVKLCRKYWKCIVSNCWWSFDTISFFSKNFVADEWASKPGKSFLFSILTQGKPLMVLRWVILWGNGSHSCNRKFSAFIQRINLFGFCNFLQKFSLMLRRFPLLSKSHKIFLVQLELRIEVAHGSEERSLVTIKYALSSGCKYFLFHDGVPLFYFQRIKLFAFCKLIKKFSLQLKCFPALLLAISL